MRAAAFAFAAALAAGALVWVAYGAEPALVTLAALAPPGVAAAVLAGRLAARPAPPAALRRRMALLAGVCGSIVVGAIALLVALMFVSGHDAFFALVVVGYALALALWTGGVVVGAMVARIAREEEMRRTLYAAISHDLRTPLTALRLLADAADDGLADASDAARMRVHLAALATLVDDLVELTRLESGALALELEPVALDALLRESADAMLPAAGGRRLEVEAVGTGTLQADPEQLQRVVFNLLQNAIRHTPEDGSVVVRAERVAGGVEVEVGDTGPGIATADRDRVFEPFVRLDPARAAEGGSGLGLAIARAIVEAHGGRIWVASAAAGARVRFHLPLLSTVLVLAVLLAGCGSASVAELPPAAGPPASPPLTVSPAGVVRPAPGAPDALAGEVEPGLGVAVPELVGTGVPTGDGRVARVAGRARELVLRDARGRRVAAAAAGVGPTLATGDGAGRVWVVDTAGDAVLQFEVAPALRLARRVAVRGGPYAIAWDAAADRLYVAARRANRITALDTTRWMKPVASWPSVRGVSVLMLLPRGRLTAIGADAFQTFDPGAAR